MTKTLQNKKLKLKKITNSSVSKLKKALKAAWMVIFLSKNKLKVLRLICQMIMIVERVVIRLKKERRNASKQAGRQQACSKSGLMGSHWILRSPG